MKIERKQNKSSVHTKHTHKKSQYFDFISTVMAVLFYSRQCNELHNVCEWKVRRLQYWRISQYIISLPLHNVCEWILTLKVLYFWKLTSYCSLKPFMAGHGGSSAGSYLADPSSPIPSHCASIVATSTLRVKAFAILEDITIYYLCGITHLDILCYHMIYTCTCTYWQRLIVTSLWYRIMMNIKTAHDT